MPTTQLVFSIHDAKGDYWPYLYVALRSVLLGSKAQSVWVLHDETLTTVARQHLEQLCAQHQSSLTFGQVSLPPYLASGNYGSYSPASIFRLSIPKFFKDYDQVVYLDCDLVFNGINIQELIDAAGDAPLSAVQDTYIGRSQKHIDQLSSLDLDPAHYFNSGVLVMRPKELPNDLIHRFMQFLQQNPIQVHPDQDFLNVQFKGLWKPLDACFNHQVGVFDESLFQPVSSYHGKVIHYAGKFKPLQGSMAPAFLPFWMYAGDNSEAGKVFDQNVLSVLVPDLQKNDTVRIRRLKPGN